MDILSVQAIMDRLGVSQVPVVSEHIEEPVGLLDRECISISCRLGSYITLPKIAFSVASR